MRLPETGPHGDGAHVDAIKKRDDAREGYQRLSELASAAVDTPAENEAADLRDAARARVRASEAWVNYVDRDVLTAWPGLSRTRPGARGVTDAASGAPPCITAASRTP